MYNGKKYCTCTVFFMYKACGDELCVRKDLGLPILFHFEGVILSNNFLHIITRPNLSSVKKTDEI